MIPLWLFIVAIVLLVVAAWLITSVFDDGPSASPNACEGCAFIHTKPESMCKWCGNNYENSDGRK